MIMKGNFKLTKSIILLSGGLDSLAALGIAKDKYGIDLALTFNYGQKAADAEISASSEICKFYNIKNKIITLDWLKDITTTALVSEKNIPTENLYTEESAKQVWVPNRNGVFLNIAAAYADSYGYDYIIYGANKDEGSTFPDNTEDFRRRISEVFEFSTLKKPKVIAPLINYSKDDIVKIAIENSVPLELVKSCYNNGDKHCGVCESCKHLKEALYKNNAINYINILFGNYEN